MKKKDEKIIKDVISQLIKLLEIDSDFEVSYQDDQAEIVLDTKDSGVVIGYHGEVLEALTLVLSLCVSKKVGRFIRIIVDVGDYRKNRSEFLKTLALQTKEKVLEEKRELSLPSLKSWERRIVHLELQDDKDVETQSIGEGRDRTLVIKPRS